jgi:hypothetical protein
MDSLSETAANNRPIQGLSRELCAMALKGQAEKGNHRHFTTVFHVAAECCRCVGRIRRRPRLAAYSTITNAPRERGGPTRAILSQAIRTET